MVLGKPAFDIIISRGPDSNRGTKSLVEGGARDLQAALDLHPFFGCLVTLCNAGLKPGKAI